MDVKQQLASKQAERDALIQRAAQVLRRDERIVAAWLCGSLGRREGDAWSDVDLWVVVQDAHMATVREGRREFVEMLGKPVLISEAPQNAPPGGAYLWVCYPGKYGPQHVDWNWQPQSNAGLPQDAKLLFDKGGIAPAKPSVSPIRPQEAAPAAALTQECAFFWGMCMVVAKYIAREKPFDVLSLMDIAGHTLSKVTWLLGTGALMSYREHAWDPDPAPFTAPDQFSLLRQVAAKMEALHPQIVEEGGQVPGEAVAEIHSLFDLADISLKS